jgi:hypothetical protein
VILFYGSSFIHVYPSKVKSTIETCGWGTDKDINNLIQMAKDTGRVQFILDRGPLDFEHYDYLEPILRDLQTPVREIIPDFLFNEKEFKKAEAEFTTLSEYKFVPFLKSAYNHYRALDSIPSSPFENFYHGYVTKYATLRVSGYDEIADTILNSLVDDPALA